MAACANIQAHTFIPQKNVPQITRTPVRLLGPCFKTGQAESQCQQQIVCYIKLAKGVANLNVFNEQKSKRYT